MQLPRPHLMANRDCRFAADSGVEAGEGTSAVRRLPGPKRVAEEVELYGRIVTLPAVILAVGDLRLLRMQRQEAGCESLFDCRFELRCLSLITTVANHIVRIALERDARKPPGHPEIEGIVE